MTVAVHELGMSFGSMDQPTERVRFLDDIDVTIAMDTRSAASGQSVILDVDITPVIFRASYTEIMLITDVVNKAASLAAAVASTNAENKADQVEDVKSTKAPPPLPARPNRAPSHKTHRRRSSVKQPQLIMTKETVSWGLQRLDFTNLCR